MPQPDLLTSIKAGRAAPVYLLLGDDEEGKRGVLEALAGLVEPELQPFNLQRIYANESDEAFDEAVAAARTLPMLGDRRVVIVLRAEALLKAKARRSRPEGTETGETGPEDEAAAPESGGSEHEAPRTAELDAYLRSPSPSSTLVLVAADINRATRTGRALLERATVVEFWGLKNDREAKGREISAALQAAERYVRQRVGEAALTIDADAVTPLVDHAGTDISVLRASVERVVTFVGGRGRITEDDVRAVVAGVAAVDDWALTRAIEQCDGAGALRQLRIALDGGASPYMVLGQLGWFVRSALPRVAPQRVKEAVGHLFACDLAMKSSGGDPQVLLERLVVELCGDDRARAGTARPLRRG